MATVPGPEPRRAERYDLFGRVSDKKGRGKKKYAGPGEKQGR
jgi:hypothetical protein